MKNEILPIFLCGYLLFFSSYKSQAQDLSYHQIDSLMANYVSQFKVKKSLGHRESRTRKVAC